MIKKSVLGGTWTGDLPIFSSIALTSAPITDEVWSRPTNQPFIHSSEIKINLNSKLQISTREENFLQYEHILWRKLAHCGRIRGSTQWEDRSLQIWGDGAAVHTCNDKKKMKFKKNLVEKLLIYETVSWASQLFYAV